jgi:hypothetical protein
MSTAKKRTGTGKGKSADAAIGDPETVDRLKRAVGAFQLRTGRTLTWKELGEAADLTPQSMTDVLRLKRRVTIRDARIWADMLSVEFSWLAIGRGPMVVMTQEEASRFGAAPLEGESAAELFARRRSEAQQKRPGSKGR